MSVVAKSAIFVVNAPMCEDAGCPSRKNCYRHPASGRVPRAEGQPYFAEATRGADETSCPWQWPLRIEDRKAPKVKRVSAAGHYTIKNDPTQVKTFISRTEVANMLGIRPTTVDRLCRRPDISFPQPMKLGNKNKHWVYAEVEAFLKSPENRGIGVRGAKPRSWIGGTQQQPAYPFIWE
ncbi:hypothetical protein [Planktothrix phage Pra-JY27]|nr:AlpA family regulatory protein [Planktothrix phage Pag-Yong1]WEV89220.1 AlpA family regulatory protein [Synechococcus phage MinM2]